MPKAQPISTTKWSVEQWLKSYRSIWKRTQRHLPEANSAAALYRCREGTAGIRHAAPLLSRGTVVKLFLLGTLYMTLGNTVTLQMKSTSTGPRSSLSSATCDSFCIPSCPVASCLVPCWIHLEQKPFVSAYFHNTNIVGLGMLVSWQSTLYKPLTKSVPWVEQRKQDTLFNCYLPCVVTLGILLWQENLPIIIFLFQFVQGKKKDSPSISYIAAFLHLLFSNICPAACFSVALNFLEGVELPQGKNPWLLRRVINRLYLILK